MRFLIVAGKGGVGRTTIAAALAVGLARAGRRVLLAQVQAKQRLGKLLGGPEVAEEIVQVRERLWAVNMTPSSALHEYGLMVLRYETLYRAVLENRLVKHFLRAIPGLDEYSMLGKVWYHTTEQLEDGRPKYDIVILDGPATGHLVAMLRIPSAILEAVPEGPLVRDARKARELLRDPARTAMVIATLAEELPAREAIELAGRVRQELGIELSHLVVNQLYSDTFVRGPGATLLRALGSTAAPSDPVLHGLLAQAEMTRQWRQVNESHLRLLEAELPLPQVRLPLLPSVDFGVKEVEALSYLLEEDHELRIHP